MAETEPGPWCFAVCRSCGRKFPARHRPDGTIRPVGIAPECTCGDADFAVLQPFGGDNG